MKKKVVETLINFFDFFHKRKIIFFLKKNKYNFDVIFDIGAHKGESIFLFLNHFKPKIIYSFEALDSNYNELKKKISKIKTKTLINIFNIGIGNQQEIKKIFILNETSSSTLKKINFHSKYFKKKDKLLNIRDNIKSKDVKIFPLGEFIINNNIKKIDFCKIDTEGSEYDILLGLKEQISKIKLILFEHHFDNMIIKNYNYSQIHSLLIKKKFKKVFKIKMPFRKTFEYIYCNEENIN